MPSGEDYTEFWINDMLKTIYFGFIELYRKKIKNTRDVGTNFIFF